MDLCFGIEIRAAMSDEFEGLDATEKAGIRAALIRCRVLAAKIANDLRNKRPEHFVDKLSLADIHTSLERVLRTDCSLESLLRLHRVGHWLQRANLWQHK